MSDTFHKFKVGDKIKYTLENNVMLLSFDLTIGREYIVLELSQFNGYATLEILDDKGQLIWVYEDWFDDAASKVALLNCVCSNNQILWGGCKCGWFETEKKNKVQPPESSKDDNDIDIDIAI